MDVDSDRPLKIAVLGPGGVGGLLAALLSRSGNAVVCIARESACAPLRENGIRVSSARFGEFSARVDAEPSLPSGIDACLVTVKATQLEAALERAPVDRLGHALVVPFLNGIEHIPVLRGRYGNAVVPATIRVEAARIAIGEIEHSSPFMNVELARGDNADVRRSEAIRILKEHLITAGIDVELRSDEQAMLWGKLSFLAPLALLTTHEGAAAGIVRTTHRAALLALIHEVSSVAEKEDVHLDEDSLMKLFDSIPETMQSSMQRDSAAGRGTEIEAIGGAILRAAERQAVEVPITARLVTDLRQQNSRQKNGKT